MAVRSMKARPLSPHLSIYKPQISTVMSIFHRITGVWLALGLPVLVVWLTFMGAGKNAYPSFVSGLRVLLGEVAVVVACMLLLLVGGLAVISRLPSGPLRPAAQWIWVVMALFCGYTLPVTFLPPEAAGFCVWIGTAMLIGWTWAFFFHFFCGMRHLFWDIGKFLSLPGMRITGWIAFILSLASTGAIWARIYGVWP